MKIEPASKCNLYNSQRELINIENHKQRGQNDKRGQITFSEVLKQTIKKY